MCFKEKFAGSSITPSSSSGDKGSSLAYLMTHAMQIRMFWIGTTELDYLLTDEPMGIDRFAFYAGAIGKGSMAPDWSIPEGDLSTAYAYGARIPGR
jgi:hypothetical protein